MSLLARVIRAVVLVRRQAVYELRTPAEIAPQETRISAAIELVTHENVRDAADFRPQAVAETFRRFLDEGQVGYFARHEGRVIGHAWAELCRATRCKGCGYMPLERDDALIHYCSVSEDFRGNNVYPAMLTALSRSLFSDHGIRRVVIDTEIDNHASMRGIEKTGFKRIGTGTYVELLQRLVYARLDPPT